MASWLRNVTNQLENVANSIDRVVQQAASEVTMSPEVELDVEKQKREEADRQLLVEQKRAEDLQKRVEELEEHLYSTNIENDAIKERYNQIISSRDEQIKKYETELEHLRNWAPSEADFDDNKLARLTEENNRLRKEIAEWKKASQQGIPSADQSKIKEFESEIRRMKEKHTEELADITYSNQQMIAEVREEYESLIQKIKDNQSPVPRLEHRGESQPQKVGVEFMREMSDSLDEIKEENTQLTEQIKELEDRIHQLMEQVVREKTNPPEDNKPQLNEELSVAKERQMSQEIERLKWDYLSLERTLILEP